MALDMTNREKVEEGTMTEHRGPRQILLVLLDGIADRVYDELGGRTPLEAAATPNLDRVAHAGASGWVYPLGPGLAPSSELAHFHLFGYAGCPFPGRAVLEALGYGVHVPVGAVLTHAGLRHVIPSARGYVVANWWPGNEDQDARRVLQDVSRFEAEAVTITLRYLGHSDSVLTLDGGSEWITDSDPFFFTGLPVIRIDPLEGAPDPDAAAQTARALNAYLLWVHGVLDRHPVNAARRARGARPLNMVVTKWTGRRQSLPPFDRRAGIPGAIVASTAVYAGFAAALGMRYIFVEERKTDPEKEVAEKVAAATDLLQSGIEFVHLHTKAADEAAHTHSPTVKRDVITAIDRGLADLWRNPDLLTNTVLAVTADHATPSLGPMLHSGDSVPLAIVAPTVRPDRVTAFGERDALGGGLGQLRAHDILPLLLNAADQARFLGGRATPDVGLGVPQIAPLRPEEY
jgi:2,3-bisphosphoglycerate-independent phosphoglycerate mutase